MDTKQFDILVSGLWMMHIIHPITKKETIQEVWDKILFESVLVTINTWIWDKDVDTYSDL